MSLSVLAEKKQQGGAKIIRWIDDFTLKRLNGSSAVSTAAKPITFIDVKAAPEAEPEPSQSGSALQLSKSTQDSIAPCYTIGASS